MKPIKYKSNTIPVLHKQKRATKTKISTVAEAAATAIKTQQQQQQEVQLCAQRFVCAYTDLM
jgi:hypothetical protein